ncbi:MAG: APC family permease [Armatimonadota bacterium]|nr:APC family permease [Armatimonadota bacterium]MDR7436306.1 APC family permease [Armatimonadota bacterium]MDR7471314.1 APC family permease [Armatimonadota bacterium]MDR7506879.1 APC family permease [Armatimonadota bacterium]MDR7509306.1 APC family permease [Armatimonadota bacterium]
MIGSVLRRVLIGPPLPTSQLIHERVSKVKGLAVFSSDALSSTAYATEEILIVLSAAGAGALSLSVPIAGAIAAVLAVVAFSYYQTIHAYPSGGGAYIVAHDNLGLWPGLVAAAALLIDYALTVSVSISSGVAAVTSAVPALYGQRVPLALLAIALVATINLRGVRESAAVFAVPTYLFVGAVGALVVVGLGRSFGHSPPPPPETTAGPASLSAWLVLRAFASGSTALTGVEAISNGIPAFYPPEARNAGITLLWMAGILGALFMGITTLAHQLGISPHPQETVLSQIARSVFGTGGMYYLVQAATSLILILAANTSFADFPRLSAILARDGFLPRQLANLGDRLVFANGIVLLALVSGLLVAAFHASTHALIPLYAVGVFLAFTLSQAGMVRRWWTRREPGWRLHMLINGVGASVTCLVLTVVVVTKFVHGAWIVALLIPGCVATMRLVHHHYQDVRRQLTLEGARLPEPIRHHKVVVPVGGIHRGVLPALRYARSLSDDVTAVLVDIDPQRTRETVEKWPRWAPGIPLRVLPSPYRSLTGPLLTYLDTLEWEVGFDQQLTIVLPEFVPEKWWHFLLHGQNALLLKVALYFRRSRAGQRVPVVTSVPYYLGGTDRPPPPAAPQAARPLWALGGLLVVVGVALSLGVAHAWPAILQQALGMAVVLLVAVFAFVLIVRSL